MMFSSLKKTQKGFTLIELLVVIAIIAILSSVVLASLSTARQKSRDAKRISDMGQVQLAMELFFDASQSYPSTTPGGYSFSGIDQGIQLLTLKGFLPKTPLPPAGSETMTTYASYGMNTDGSECSTNACMSYLIGISLERSDNTVLSTDADSSIASKFYGSYPDCIVNTAGADKCYDLKP